MAEEVPISPSSDDRRTFFKKVLAVAIGTLIVLVPSAAGLTVLFDPLRRKANKAEFLPVTNLDALPDDDLPHSFQVVADRRDAWNLYPAQRIGAEGSMGASRSSPRAAPSAAS